MEEIIWEIFNGFYFNLKVGEGKKNCFCLSFLVEEEEDYRKEGYIG